MINFQERFSILFVCVLLFLLASCSMAEKRMNKMDGGVGEPTDTSVSMRPESIENGSETIPSKISGGPMNITIQEAIFLSLENNRALIVERLNPSIQKTFEDVERSVFDPVINAEISAQRIDAENLARSEYETDSFVTDIASGSISLEKFFPTGTTVDLGFTGRMEDSSLYSDRFFSTGIDMTITQALLQGSGSDVNLVRLRQARLGTKFSEYELRGFSQSIVAEVETTYWDYALAKRQIEIFKESLKLVRQQLSETKDMISVGKLAKAELDAVQAEVAAQEQGLINARSKMSTTRLRLLRLLNPPGPDIWSREVDLIHPPTIPEIKLDDVALHVAVSMRMRPELNQARLDILRNDLDIVKTKNGLLPLMNLFITLGPTGYADSFGSSISHLNLDSYEALVGAEFKYPVFNRNAKARYNKSLLSREQAEKALANLSQLVEVDVQTAYIEVNRSKQQVSASKATRIFNEDKLRTETEKFRVGASTNFQVAQAQRDLLASRINEVEAIVNYLKSLINLYRLDGSLLDRRGISAPGREPVELAIKNTY